MSKKQRAGVKFEDIPNEILVEVFLNCEESDVFGRIALCKKRFHEIVQSELFFRLYCKVKFGNKLDMNEVVTPILDDMFEKHQTWGKVLKNLHRDNKYLRKVRVCYVPKCGETGGNQCGIKETKFGGTPFLKNDEGWPQCECGKYHHFIMQFNSKDMPSKDIFSEDSLFQYFTCLECECEQNLVRVVSGITEAEGQKDVDPSKYLTKENCEGSPFGEDLTKIAETPITGWTRKFDYPHDDDDGGMDELHIFENKLLGYQTVINIDESETSCKLCKEQLRFLFQLDSSDDGPVPICVKF